MACGEEAPRPHGLPVVSASTGQAAAGAPRGGQEAGSSGPRSPPSAATMFSFFPVTCSLSRSLHV